MDNKIITGDEPINPLYSFGSIPQNKEERALVEGGSLYSGLTIRQEFARSAMAVLAGHLYHTGNKSFAEAAEIAVDFADALIAELNKPIL